MQTLSCAFVVATATLVAQEAVPRALVGQPPFSGVFVSDPHADGAIWARGHRYKLGLECGRAHFQPLFGPRAPRDYPLTLSLRSVRVGAAALLLESGQPARVGERRLEVDHGRLVERWDLTPAAARQSFVIDAPLGEGALPSTSRSRRRWSTPAATPPACGSGPRVASARSAIRTRS
jgi:hypothetical protein